MKEQIVENILNGMSIPFFLAMLFWAFAGVLVFFLSDVISHVWIDDATPKVWSWKAFLKGMARVVIGLIVLLLAIINFGELSKMVFRIPDPLEMNGLVAFFIGMGIDAIVARVVKFGRNPTRYLYKKVKGNGYIR